MSVFSWIESQWDLNKECKRLDSTCAECTHTCLLEKANGNHTGLWPASHHCPGTYPSLSPALIPAPLALQCHSTLGESCQRQAEPMLVREGGSSEPVSSDSKWHLNGVRMASGASVGSAPAAGQLSATAHAQTHVELLHQPFYPSTALLRGESTSARG